MLGRSPRASVMGLTASMHRLIASSIGPFGEPLDAVIEGRLALVGAHPAHRLGGVDRVPRA